MFLLKSNAEEKPVEDFVLQKQIEDALSNFGKQMGYPSAALTVANTTLDQLGSKRGIAEALLKKSWKLANDPAHKGCCGDTGTEHYEAVLSLAAQVNSPSIMNALFQCFDYRNKLVENDGPFSTVPRLVDWETSQPEVNCPAAQILLHQRNEEEVKESIVECVVNGNYRTMTPVEKTILARIWLRLNVKEFREARGLADLEERLEGWEGQLKTSKNRLDLKASCDALREFIKIVGETAYPELDMMKSYEEGKKKQKQKIKE
jgi:hypothetical protein